MYMCDQEINTIHDKIKLKKWESSLPERFDEIIEQYQERTGNSLDRFYQHKAYRKFCNEQGLPTLGGFGF